MRLLPHDERVDRARALAPFGPDHLRPPGAAHAVRLGARLRVGSCARYHGMLRSSSSGRPHTAKCAACQACISRWNLPFQLLENSPSSCGGTLPALLMAVRYCDITMRRSSSFARGSRLPVKSTTPPCIQIVFPALRHGFARGFRGRHRRGRRVLRELHQQRELRRAGRGEPIRVRRGRGDVELAIRRDAHGVARVVELAREREPAGAARHFVRRHALPGCAQSAGSGFSFAATPGNFRSTPSRPSASSVERSRTMMISRIGMHGGFHLHRRAVEHEAAREPAGPHVQRLARRGQIGERRGLAVGPRQMQARAGPARSDAGFRAATGSRAASPAPSR